MQFSSLYHLIQYVSSSKALFLSVLTMLTAQKKIFQKLEMNSLLILLPSKKIVCCFLGIIWKNLDSSHLVVAVFKHLQHIF